MPHTYLLDFFCSIYLHPKKPKGGRTGALKWGTLWDFFNIHSVAKYEKIEGGLSGDIENFSKKVSQSREN